MSSGVEFDEDKFSYAARARADGAGSSGSSGMPAGNEPKMVQWLMRRGWAKSPLMGQGILIGVVILNIVIVYVVIKYFL